MHPEKDYVNMDKFRNLGYKFKKEVLYIHKKVKSWKG